MAFHINKLHQISPRYSCKMPLILRLKREEKITNIKYIKGEIIIFIGAMVKFIGELFITLMKNIMIFLMLKQYDKHLLGMSTVNFYCPLGLRY